MQEEEGPQTTSFLWFIIYRGQSALCPMAATTTLQNGMTFQSRYRVKKRHFRCIASEPSKDIAMIEEPCYCVVFSVLLLYGGECF